MDTPDAEIISPGAQAMAAYLIANITVHDPQGYESYRSLASKTVAAFGGRYIVRGGEHRVLEGTWAPNRLVILEFPTMARLMEWYESEAYGEAKPFRIAHATSEFVAVEGA
jgi:uncharacterized protein (DUF1330 family)